MPISAPETRRLNFTAAVDAAGGVEPFCRRFEMNSDYVRQLLRGGGKGSTGRNIGNRAARTIEAKLGLPVNQLDQVPIGARVADHVAGLKAAESAPPSAARRLENDVDALRYALGALVTGLAITQPDAAAAVELALRQAPEKFQDRGLIPGLLEALDAGRKASKATEKAGARPRATPQSA